MCGLCSSPWHAECSRCESWCWLMRKRCHVHLVCACLCVFGRRQAAIPSVVVPILKWSDQPLFGKQLQQQGLGEVVTNEALIPSSIQRVLDSAAVQRCAQAAGHSLANEHGLVVTASALESCLCQRVKPSTTADVEFCQRHCVKCNTRLRRASTGAARLALGWDVYYQPKPRTWTNVVVHAVMWLLFAWCLWQLVVLFRR